MFRARGCTPEEAADLAQDAAVRAFVHIRRWGVNGTGLDPLLNRIARNLLIDRYRRTTPHIVPLDDAGELQDPDQDPTEEVVRRQRTHAVRSAIKGLPVRHQTAITYSLNGLTPEEVGRRMGIGRNAADALLHRARRSLKERLQTVGEGMFGIALGIRVRWDHMLRRAGLDGIESRAGDVGVTAASSAAVSLAAAAVLTVMSVMGGSGQPPSLGGARVHAAIVGASFAADASSMMSAPTSGTTGSVSGPAASGSSGGTTSTYKLGPTQTSYSDDRVDQRVTLPDPTNPGGPPMLQLDHGIYKEYGDPYAAVLCAKAERICRVLRGDGA
jgi:RNA polymerase sigma factor (sigma-70 family)